LAQSRYSGHLTGPSEIFLSFQSHGSPVENTHIEIEDLIQTGDLGASSQHHQFCDAWLACQGSGQHRDNEIAPKFVEVTTATTLDFVTQGFNRDSRAVVCID
jgi:hypothetical protein